MRFVDTNVLLYAISKASDEAAKAEIAIDLLELDDLALSVQVLQEFYVQATRRGKSDHDYSHCSGTDLTRVTSRARRFQQPGRFY